MQTNAESLTPNQNCVDDCTRSRKYGLTRNSMLRTALSILRAKAMLRLQSRALSVS